MSDESVPNATEPMPDLTVSKVDKRGAHWKLKRNTNEAARPGRWTLFWANEEKTLRHALHTYMLNNPALPFLQLLPWALAQCPFTVGNQCKTIWMHLYLCHLKGIISVRFVPEFFYTLKVQASDAASALRLCFVPTMHQDSFHNSFFGIQGFRVHLLTDFNAHALFPMPSGYYSDTEPHANPHIFGKKALVRTWHAMGMKEISSTEMVFDSSYSDRIRLQHDKQLARRAATKALLALHGSAANGTDPTPRKRSRALLPLKRPMSSFTISADDTSMDDQAQEAAWVNEEQEETAEELIALPYLALMRNDVRQAQSLLQVTFAHFNTVASLQDDDKEIEEAHDLFQAALSHLQSTCQSLEQTKRLSCDFQCQ